MKIIKKNQIIIFVIALMLVTAGYLNYTTGEGEDTLATSGLADNAEVAEIGDAKLVSSNSLTNEESSSISSEKNNNISNNTVSSNVVNNEENQSKTNIASNNVENGEKTVTTSTKNSNKNNDDYFTNSRLTRDTMYSQMIESYQKILNNTSVSADQKAISQTEIKKINDLKNSIMICENLIKTKGISDVVIFANDTSISVIIKTNGEEVTKEQAAQIQNIVAREMKAEIENIHISNK
ncbi:MAG: SpoIIIAH-like family protein [Clostridia bacterium]|nr:SpoIIIAH-like family protein [Clostridiaceae bacterium]